MICLAYRLRWSPAALEFLGSLRDKKLKERLFKAVEKLRQNPHPPGSIKMAGRPDYRIRIGDYRIIYRIAHNELLIEIAKVGHRKDIYR